jgi:hypothetical protein
VNDPRAFNFSTLQRLVDFSAVRDALGIETDEKHGFTTKLKPERFQKLLTKVVSDIARGTVTSRTHNTAGDVDKYLVDIQKDLGKATKTTKATKSIPAETFVDPSRLQPKPAPKQSKTKPKPPRVPVGLIPKGFVVDIEDSRIEDIVDELKALNIVSFPNATAIMFRSLLDMALTKYLHDSGELRAIKAQQSKKQQRPADWIPTLKQQLEHVLQNGQIPLGPEARKALQKFMSDSSQWLTLDALNWYTHIRYTPPTVDQLRAFWTMLTPLAELTLQKPKP